MSKFFNKSFGLRTGALFASAVVIGIAGFALKGKFASPQED